MDEFSVIGIAPEATPEQITTAWKAAARLTHPDMFPEATAEQRKYLNDRMAALNAAYHTLSDPAGLARARRLRQAASHNEADLRPENAATPEGRAGSRHPQPPARPAATDGCELCGSVPSARMSFKQVTGMLFSDRIRTVQARLCRDCAQGIGREMQSRTLVTGWWGLVAFFRNLAAIVGNLNSLFRAFRMAAPSAPDGWRTFPMPVGAGLFKRPLTWVGVGLIGLFVGVGVVNSNREPSTYDSPAIGRCISGFSNITVVPCSASHNGRIVTSAYTSEGCPASAESYITYQSTVYCIDDNS